MKTTKTVAYALACLHQLTKKLGEFMQVVEIARNQAIPAAYCQKVLLAMSRAGLVESVKGKGFRLLKPFETITTLEVIQALRSEEKEEKSWGENTQDIHHILTLHLERLMAGLRIAEVVETVR